MIRQKRKINHVQLTVQTEERVGDTWFNDVTLVYNALTELDYASIDTSVDFLGKRLAAPILINAMTGGHPDVESINRSLARIAAKNGLAMAVGSQTIALEDKTVKTTFEVVRTENPKGVVLANLNARSPWENVQEAILMIEADAVQLHLNVAHELAMMEGDRSFKGILANIESIVARAEVPVIVKEVGFGLSREVVAKLYQVGVKYIDVGGKGGTDFAEIERLRAGHTGADSSLIMGIPTAVSLLEALSLEFPVFVVASGGMTKGYEVVTALSLGASMVGIAGHFLRILINQSEEALQDRVGQMKEELRRIMLLCGATDVEGLRRIPVIISGRTEEWLSRRGVDTDRYARR